MDSDTGLCVRPVRFLQEFVFQALRIHGFQLKVGRHID
jgi:hypothetical protein